MDTKCFPFGFWPSHLSSAQIAKANRRISSVSVYKDWIYWIESNSAGKRNLMRAKPDSLVEPALSSKVELRTRVHEYGGGEYGFSDNALCYLDDAAKTVNLQTNSSLLQSEVGLENNQIRLAEPVAFQDNWIFVRERTGENLAVINELVLWDFKTQEYSVLATGADFYASPTLNLQGDKIAYLSWCHPQMPWDGCELILATVEEGRIKSTQKIAGGRSESIYQPTFGPDGALYFVSDQSGWWNLQRYDGSLCTTLLSIDAEFGLAQWNFGTNLFAFINNEEIIAVSTKNAIQSLNRIHIKSGNCERLPSPFTFFGDNVRVYREGIVCVAGSPTIPTQLVYFELETQKFSVIRHDLDYPFEEPSISKAQALCISDKTGESIHAFYYPPKLEGVTGPVDELPPLLVFSHSGPTSFSSNILNPKVQFWTTRGFAVLDVNYRGSTGFGRVYREKLNENWGTLDVSDCVDCVEALIEKKLVDTHAIFIRGSSAGGFTTLCALVFTNRFTGGLSLYGVGDLEQLLKETPKFESHYLETLIGRYPEYRDKYFQRSPIHHIEQLNAPLLILQGSEDTVVPPSQAESLVKVLKEKKLPVEYHLFPNEGHGFRDPKNIAKVYDIELSFYQKMLT